LILVDANLLLYAYDASAENQRIAQEWLESVFEGSEPIGLAWVTLLAFLRIGTNPRAFVHPFSIGEAVGVVSDWISQPQAVLVNPGERHWEILRDLIPASQARGPLVMDAHLAAMAIENGATLCTSDRDFARFRGLKVEYPLE
jgi:uncharacterized protein